MLTGGLEVNNILVSFVLPVTTTGAFILLLTSLLLLSIIGCWVSSFLV
jgi:hypothetical protein